MRGKFELRGLLCVPGQSPPPSAGRKLMWSCFQEIWNSLHNSQHMISMGPGCYAWLGASSPRLAVHLPSWPPNSSAARATSRCRSSGRETSATRPSTCHPSRRHSASSSSKGPALRAQVSTLQGEVARPGRASATAAEQQCARRARCGAATRPPTVRPGPPAP